MKRRAAPVQSMPRRETQSIVLCDNRVAMGASPGCRCPAFFRSPGYNRNGNVWRTFTADVPAEAGATNGGVGCENAGHGKGSNPPTKAGHGLGGAQRVCTTGDNKWTKLERGPTREYGSRAATGAVPSEAVRGQRVDAGLSWDPCAI